MTSVCLCTYINSQKRLDDLQKTLQSLANNVTEPAEIIIVDDNSPMQEQVQKLFAAFSVTMKKFRPEIDICITVNAENMKHAASQNKSWALAEGEVLIHIEDDIVVDVKGWNQIFAKCLQDHPEVGQVLPSGSGRGEWIPRPGYKEFAWGLGGLFAIKREVYEKVGGWDETLVHQIEPDYNFRVRMAGWRLAQIDDFAMGHLGEGDFMDTFERQAQITIGVYNFLKKWNRRFMGAWGYRTVWSMSPDDFPINVAFRRQLAAWYAAEGEKLVRANPGTDAAKGFKPLLDCRMNFGPQPFQYPGHWGKYELVKLIRPTGREREDELIEKMGSNYVFGDEPELHKQVKELAQRMNKPMTDEEVAAFLKGKEWDYEWGYEGKRI